MVPSKSSSRSTKQWPWYLAGVAVVGLLVLSRKSKSAIRKRPVDPNEPKSQLAINASIQLSGIERAFGGSDDVVEAVASNYAGIKKALEGCPGMPVLFGVPSVAAQDKGRGLFFVEIHWPASYAASSVGLPPGLEACVQQAASKEKTLKGKLKSLTIARI